MTDYQNRKIRRLKQFTLTSTLALMMGFTQVHAAGGEVVNFNMSPMALSEALVKFSTKTKLIVWTAEASDAIKDIRSNRLEGQHDAKEALKMLLAGSGLVYEFKGNDTVIIKKDNAQKTRSSDADRSSIRGHVTEINSGSNLAGVLVKIVETGQTTKTDELGSFYFPSVVPGNYTLSISYLGYASLVTELFLGRGEEFQNEFSMGKPLGELDEIVVFGSRSARAMALNLQRTAKNSSDVISADMLGNFTGTTIAEALRRVPGVAFSRNAATGDGSNIFIRGLSPDMSAVKFNGLQLPIGSGILGSELGRSAALNNLLADSVEKITIHKSLLPSHDSAGTGGLVEIETKSPLNRPHRYANFAVEGGWKDKDFADDFLVSGTVAGTFGGEENFGLSLSVQYRKRHQTTISYEGSPRWGQYLPLEQDGSTSIGSYFHVNPFVPFPFEPEASDVFMTGLSNRLNETDTENLAMTVSAEWQLADHTNLKLHVQHATNSQSEYFRQGNISFPVGYSVMPVQALGGEERQALAWSGNIQLSQEYSWRPDEKSITDTYSLQGNSQFGKWNFNYTLGYAHGGTIQSAVRQFEFKRGTPGVPLQLDPAFLLPSAVDPVEGRVISPFGAYAGNGYPVPLLTEEGWAFINSPETYNFEGGTYRPGGRSFNDRYTANFDVKYDFDQKYLKNIEAGVRYEGSKFGRAETEQITSLTNFYCEPGDFFCIFGQPHIPPMVGSLGLEFAETDLSNIGISGPGFNFVSNDDIIQYFKDIPALTQQDDPPLYLQPHPFLALYDARNLSAFLKESSLAGYVQSQVNIGKLEIIGGARLNRVSVLSYQLSQSTFIDENGVPDLEFEAAFNTLLEQRGSTTDILPRILFNYRQTDNLVFRGGYFLSVARPGLSQLSSHSSYDTDLREQFGPSANQPRIRITEGNPGLKPSRTHNFDISAEYYDDDIGVIKLSFFYKRTHNELLNNITIETNPDLDALGLPDHPHFQNLPANLFVVRNRPENSEHDSTVWGIEGSVEKRFTFLPGFWNGFGVYANYLYSKSSRYDFFDWYASPVFDDDGNFVGRELQRLEILSASYNGAPRQSGTAALTYNKHGIDASLTYSFQARFKNVFSPNNLGPRGEGAKTMDFRIAYFFETGRGRYRAFFEVTDLLKNAGSPDLETVYGGSMGTPEIHNGAIYFGGRSMRLGLNASF